MVGRLGGIKLIGVGTLIEIQGGINAVRSCFYYISLALLFNRTENPSIRHLTCAVCVLTLLPGISGNHGIFMPYSLYASKRLCNSFVAGRNAAEMLYIHSM